MKAADLKAGTTYSRRSTPGVLLNTNGTYGEIRGGVGSEYVVGRGRNYPVLVIGHWGERITVEQLEEAAKDFAPCAPGGSYTNDDLPAGTFLEFWPPRSFEGEYAEIVAREADLQAKRKAVAAERQNIIERAREDREETKRRLDAVIPNAGHIFEGGSPASVTISIADLKALINIAEGAK